MTYKGAIAEVKMLLIDPYMPDIFKPSLKKIAETLEMERPKGKWIDAKVGRLFPSNDFKCSICGNILDFDGLNCGRGDANFCPNCGADMRGKVE